MRKDPQQSERRRTKRRRAAWVYVHRMSAEFNVRFLAWGAGLSLKIERAPVIAGDHPEEERLSDAA